MKVVFDTNILISGIGWAGRERKLLLLALSEEYELVMSDKILKELVGVLQRKKFSHLDKKKIFRFIDIFTRVCTVVVPEKHHTVIKEDPDDDMVLDCALDVKAEYIVTGDHHLLDLKEFKGVRIVDSATFEKILEK